MDPPAEELISYEGEKISVELFVMSRCPDAVACEEVMADVGAYHCVILNKSKLFLNELMIFLLQK